ncbi:CUB and sushi domain-containing protein 3-like isoform X2 [Lagopus muta]|uniref:CUB and sushi domain-containing protein 3-like isoform X2 n=1 Tax=Lagopus muta TaxID=64668 RepID=UPI00209EEE51|nr:CUB and sushi domain-containing protein 3-like isoform X2 [Lagopus muta]
MGLVLLFLTMLATLVSSEHPEGDLDTYWSGTAPICMGGCKGKHKELKRSQCGNGSCCWLGYKSFCRVNCGRPEADFNSVVHGNDWWVGSVVRYSCRPGFMLLGNPASACQSDGHWTPKPTCLREYSGVGWLLLSQQPTVGKKGLVATLGERSRPAPAGICLRGRIEISERDISGSCSSSCSTQNHLGASLRHGCIKISSCSTKRSGWVRWFLRCDVCECDCHVPCGETQ